MFNQRQRQQHQQDALLKQHKKQSHIHTNLILEMNNYTTSQKYVSSSGPVNDLTNHYNGLYNDLSFRENAKKAKMSVSTVSYTFKRHFGNSDRKAQISSNTVVVRPTRLARGRWQGLLKVHAKDPTIKLFINIQV